MKYTAEYFINKFEAIPPSKWTTGVFKNGKGQSCALGHCGAHICDFTEEAFALRVLLNPTTLSTIAINDGYSGAIDFGDTPEERIINALTLIASK